MALINIEVWREVVNIIHIPRLWASRIDPFSNTRGCIYAVDFITRSSSLNVYGRDEFNCSKWLEINYSYILPESYWFEEG